MSYSVESMLDLPAHHAQAHFSSMEYTYRFATRADFPGYLELYKGEVSHSFGGCFAASEDVEGEWSAPGFDTEQMMVLDF